MKNLEKILLAGALAVFAAGCGDVDGTNNNGGGGTPDPVTYTREETWRNRIMDEGVCLTSWWWNDYLQAQTDATLEGLHDLGVESISILVTEYQDTSSSTAIYPLSSKTPAEEGIRHVIRKAKSLGMKTVLKPHVDVRDNSWRGYISFSNESDWADWFNSYQDFISYYAGIAEEEGADVLIIGTELKGTTHRDEWGGLIDSIRSEFSGDIVYAANWDNYKKITWWDKLDYIGVNAYFPLTSYFDPTIEELESAWQPIVDELRDFSNAQGKQVVITEVGYESLDGANISPWYAPSSVYDEQEQADCYQAMFNMLWNQDFVAGIYPWMKYWQWYDWQVPDGFDFGCKKAELVVDDVYHLAD
ncbi:hypothetical protein JW707_01650 [Candidatus Woesearchaeota archaeon]|nr:hypothetical protein [Candidatus Woesearchaeota archaeon]